MKLSGIPKVLDLAYTIRKNGGVYNPLFIGHSGIGKSQSIQQWAEAKKKTNPDFGFFDLRIAYLDAPDLIGLPHEVKRPDGSIRMVYSLPDFWPTSGEGLIVLEEPNRGNSAVMNALMQLLTDRKVHDYTLPEGWMIAGAINPECSEYDVKTMDSALMNRFTSYEIMFEKSDFIKYIESKNWNKNVVNYAKNYWTYCTPGSNTAQGKMYISPRSLERLNEVEKSNDPSISKPEFRNEVLNSILGNILTKEYNKSVDLSGMGNLKYEDFKQDEKKALSKVKSLKMLTNTVDIFSGLGNSILESAHAEDDMLTNPLVYRIIDTFPEDLKNTYFSKIIDIKAEKEATKTGTGDMERSRLKLIKELRSYPLFAEKMQAWG